MIAIEAHGARIPAIGLGTWPMKGKECAEAVATALRIGYRHIDTAAAYDNEDAVGDGIRASGVPREEVFVTTKVWHTDLADRPFQRSVEKSLSNLRLEYADLVLIHWPSRSLTPADMIKPLNAVKRRGMARHVGVANFTVPLFEAAWAATKEPLVANQCEYHPYLSQEKVLAACRKRGTAFVSYTPLGRREVFDDPVVQDIAGRLSRTPAQVVLRWHIQQPGVAAIPKSARPAHIAANFDLDGFSLDPTDMAALSALAYPGGRMISFDASPSWDD